MKDMHGILFAYSTDKALKELTEHRTAASIPFGGRYRAVDFMLSNMVNADITSVGVVMCESYQSLLDHLGAGKDWDLSRKRGGLKMLPPFDRTGMSSGSIFRGRLEALASVKEYIKRIRQEYVVFGDADLIANIPLDKVFDEHIRSGADITSICTKKHSSEPEDAAYFTLNNNNRVVDVMIGRPQEHTYEYMKISILSTRLLNQLIEHCAAHNLYSIQVDILQQMNKKLKIHAYVFDGYYCNLTSVMAYYKHSMELLKADVRKDLFYRGRPIKTKVRDEASTYYGPDSEVHSSVVADGCYIEGKVENSVLFRGVKVEKGAQVSNCILFQDTHVYSDAILRYAIADKDVRVMNGRTLMGDSAYPIALSKGSVI